MFSSYVAYARSKSERKTDDEDSWGYHMIIERGRQWANKRYEARMSAADDFADFEEWASGPWTPEMVRRMPWKTLRQGPQLGEIDPETRRVINYEMERRQRSIQPVIANIISVIALAVAVLAHFK